MIGLIIAEGSLFAVFVVAYLFYIGEEPPRPISEGCAARAGLVNTICLLASSVTVGLRRCGRSREATSGAPAGGSW